MRSHLASIQEGRSDVTIDLCVHNPCEMSPVYTVYEFQVYEYVVPTFGFLYCLPECLFYLLCLFWCVYLPVFVSFVGWRNRLKIEGRLRCPKMEATHAPR